MFGHGFAPRVAVSWPQLFLQSSVFCALKLSQKKSILFSLVLSVISQDWPVVQFCRIRSGWEFDSNQD